MQDLVSVVVPIYNVEQYIDKCISSIVNQTYSNIEIILVNDCATDNSLLKCEEWKNKDNRIRIVNKSQNEGLSAARNSGLKISRGKYITFIDGDDYIDFTFISELLEMICRYSADIVACSYYYAYESKNKIRAGEFESIQILIGNDAFIECMKYPSSIDVITWNKMYKKELFEKNSILFPKGKIHEDFFTTYKLLAFSKKVVYIDKPLYFYVQRATSIIHTTCIEKEKDLLICHDEFLEFIEDHHITIDKKYIDFYCYRILLQVVNCLANNVLVTDIQLWREVTKRMKRLNSLSKISIKYKLVLILMKFPYLYIFFRKCYRRCKLVLEYYHG